MERSPTPHAAPLTPSRVKPAPLGEEPLPHSAPLTSSQKSPRPLERSPYPTLHPHPIAEKPAPLGEEPYSSSSCASSYSSCPALRSTRSARKSCGYWRCPNRIPHARPPRSAGKEVGLMVWVGQGQEALKTPCGSALSPTRLETCACAQPTILGTPALQSSDASTALLHTVSPGCDLRLPNSYISFKGHPNNPLL